jgi:MFS family permease
MRPDLDRFATGPAPGPRPPVFRSLRVRNYRLYASGQLVSLTGTWMQRVAQDWLVLTLTGSGTALGVVTALQFAPGLLLGPWGGLIADRSDKRRLLVVTQSAIGLLALVLGALTVTGLVAYWQVLLLAGLLGLATAVDTPTRQSFVVEMVGPADLPNAVGINSTIFNAARIAGPAAAGGLIAAVGTGWAFMVNGVSSAAVVAGLIVMRPSELAPAPTVERVPGQLREGLRYVVRHRELALAMLLTFMVGTFGLNFQLSTALLARNEFHRSAASFGLLSMALATGAFAGALLAARRVRRPTLGELVLVAAAFGVAEIAAGTMPTFAATAAMLVPTGLAMLTFTTAANMFVQLGVEDTMRGRVMALYLMCFLGGTPLGAPLVGWAGSALGPRWGLIGGGIVSLAAASAFGLHLARGARPGAPSRRVRSSVTTSSRGETCRRPV